ncbi:cation diffusion facilitator family transporter [Phenylobacterium sp. LjRoot225]|uniref:cation diffusion facilitator family transporter n=1 Tax=Phenylobacterium sp. LjRoot225 TaxID=3342285 RepID=UPI003ECF2E34
MLSAARPDPIAFTGREPPRELDGFRSNRTYLGADHRRNERRTWIVVAICAVTCAAQLAGGTLFHSMALTASGLHMAAHVAVLLTAAGAYWLARRLAGDARFAFGAGKVGYLAGFANAVVLVITAVTIAVESIERLLTPEVVDFGAAIPLAGAGLVVTLICVWLLRPSRSAKAHHDPEGDLNLSAAHLHLTADAIISALSIAGLAAGQALGWGFADPLMGLIGAGLVAQFAYSLIRRAGAALLDVNPSPVLTEEIRTRLEAAGARVLDLHLWRLGPGHHAAVAVVTADPPAPAETYRARLEDIPGLSHLTIEVRGGGGHGHVC